MYKLYSFCFYNYYMKWGDFFLYYSFVFLLIFCVSLWIKMNTSWSMNKLILHTLVVCLALTTQALFLGLFVFLLWLSIHVTWNRWERTQGIVNECIIYLFVCLLYYAFCMVIMRHVKQSTFVYYIHCVQTKSHWYCQIHDRMLATDTIGYAYWM